MIEIALYVLNVYGYELPAKDEHNFISRMLYKIIILYEMN